MADISATNGSAAQNGNTGTAATKFFMAFGGVASDKGTEALVQTPMARACTLSQTRFHVNSSNDSGANTMSSRINGAGGNISLSVGGLTTARSVQDTTHSDSVVGGDLVNYQTAHSGSYFFNSGELTTVVTAADHPYRIYHNGGTSQTWSATVGYPFMDGSTVNGSSTTETHCGMAVKAAGEFDHLGVHVTTAIKQTKPQIVAVYRYVQSGDTTALPAPFSGSNLHAVTVAELSGMTGTFANDLRSVKEAYLASGATLTTATDVSVDNNNLALLTVANYHGTAAMTVPSGWNSDINNFNNSNYGSWFMCDKSLATSGTSVGGDAITVSSSSNPSSYVQAIFGASGQSPAVVQSIDASGTSTFAAITLSATPTVGNLVVAYALWRDGSAAAPTIGAGWTQFAITTFGDGGTGSLGFRNNQASGNQAVTVADTDTGWIIDTTHSDSVVSGDACNTMVSGTVASGTYFGIVEHFAGSGTAYDTFSASTNTSEGNAVSSYVSLFGHPSPTSTEANMQCIWDEAGDVFSLRAQRGHGTSSVGGTLTFVNNTVVGNQTVTVGSTQGLSYEDSTHTDGVLPADLIDVNWVGNGTSSMSQMSVTFDTGGGGGGSGTGNVVVCIMD